MTRLNDIETAIRHYLEAKYERSCANEAGEIVTELLDRHLIGLPKHEDGSSRTSVRTDLVAELGAKLGCRKGDDADDVLRQAIKHA